VRLLITYYLAVLTSVRYSQKAREIILKEKKRKCFGGEILKL